MLCEYCYKYNYIYNNILSQKQMSWRMKSGMVIIERGGYISLTIVFAAIVISYQLKLIKMRANLANLNDCAVPFLNRAAVKLGWYNYR